ncbi:ABC transporter ATP-binding protein [Phytoactinopolyspora alkaliphila]|uniref:ABC transporter ATP-binding protein n=1 Tax=Phytoactinopolyspora alkaliphila TaxID=1783498 RepID=A0A6N9YIC4_9ACTN|nr:dipeptide/oligopeptide/nickel ABC transporter ATP-binding protein [Phytoactinopolyspora alkaliphila]NED94756.1 ABC transporter ATP-binding protein [Phytoactinopolyspora alkaliphila]
MAPLVDVRDLSFRYGHKQNWVLRSLNLSIERGSAVGVVGESGSGKSTLVRLLCGLLPVGSGSVTYDGRAVTDWLSKDPRQFRLHNQMVFQSPAASLDPRMRIRRSVAEPVRALERRKIGDDELESWLSMVGLGPEALNRYPHQFSGGQLQRVAIARALSVSPTVLYADEPTSALDVSVQAQVLNLLMDLRARLGLTLVIVSHDLAVVSRMCEHILVMRNGEIVESGPTVDVLHSPSSAYTNALTKAASAVSLRPGNVTSAG